MADLSADGLGKVMVAHSGDLSGEKLAENLELHLAECLEKQLVDLLAEHSGKLMAGCLEDCLGKLMVDRLERR